MNLLPKIMRQSDDQLADSQRQQLLHIEAKIGGELFGPIPKGARREFFCLDEQTWVWYEEWTDAAGQRRSLTTRYDVRPNAVLKSQGGQAYQRVSDHEARNLLRAAELYEKRVSSVYQQMLQPA